jgi:DNA-directed RNA polymerase specialized sigma24 family protein
MLMVKTKKKSEHYVNNKDFYQALVEYKKQVDNAKEKGLPKPRISNYLGDCFLRIANHLAYKPNFVNYMFKDDMICDGIENCVQYIHNFDTNRTNPFAYFTQIVYYAFLRRIAKEKKQLEIKSKIIERSGYDEVFTSEDGDYSDMNSIKDNINYRFS